MRDPTVNEVELLELRPTQMTVGLHEVAAKRREWREARAGKRLKILGGHAVPTVLGPKGRYYVVDHHHLARALLDEGEKTLQVYILSDLRAVEKAAFWTVLDNSGWCHAYDHRGRRCELSDIPKSLADMKDDPYRSLAGQLRRSGGFAKTDKPFSEFIWADFLRRRVEQDMVETDFAGALVKALECAKAQDARYLPGWCGVEPG
ncbi:ParB-like protein [Caulobacter sp. S45]|uniref:ParB-like protein n=1 Tax=Caulobacter sp. S45 TaxID=1641861 RepID=UPI0015771210|nr:ParB-like protein [Caulobacter sp. S45]